jgi:hypothetical protein
LKQKAARVSNDIEANGGNLYFPSLDEISSEFPERNEENGCRWKDMKIGIERRLRGQSCLDF